MCSIDVHQYSSCKAVNEESTSDNRAVLDLPCIHSVRSALCLWLTPSACTLLLCWSFLSRRGILRTIIRGSLLLVGLTALMLLLLWVSLSLLLWWRSPLTLCRCSYRL